MKISISSSKILLIFSFVISILISNYYLNKYDKIVTDENGRKYHQMIKYDALRYISHGAEIKDDLDNGINFFKTGREHFTKYLPPRITALIFYVFNIDLYEDDEKKKITTGVYKPYIFIQCIFYYLSLLFFLFSTKNVLNPKYLFFVLLFLALEPNILQYHGTFWSETYFFAFQIIIIGLIINDKKNIFTYFLIGFFVGMLSLQKQYAIFFAFPIIVYFYCFNKKSFFSNISVLLIGFFLTQCFVGYNNYKRSGVFYFFANDNNLALHLDLVPKVINEIKGYTGNEFIFDESKEMQKWIINNSINYNKDLIVNNHYLTYRDSIFDEKDKLLFDEEIRKRTFMYIREYPLEFFLKIVNHGFHIILLNPFHVYSDHNFKSGEIYHLSEKHNELLKYRIIYTLTVYLICLYGLFKLFREKKYKLITIVILSIIYFYSLSFWHGNTRYYMPVYIYFSFFFARSMELFSSKIKLD